jgi:hypothetical protein
MTTPLKLEAISEKLRGRTKYNRGFHPSAITTLPAMGGMGWVLHWVDPSPKPMISKAVFLLRNIEYFNLWATQSGFERLASVNLLKSHKSILKILKIT